MKLKIICLLFLSLIVMVSCGSSKPSAIIETKENTRTITQTIHDTVVKIEKDSSSYKALLACENGKIVIKEIAASEPGRILKSPKVRIRGNVLVIDCEAKAQEAVLHYINTHQVDTQTHTLPIRVNELTFWQELQIWGFRLLSIAILLFIGFIYLKSKL